MTDPGTHLFWITSRAAGISALVLAGLAVAAGLAIGTRLARNANMRTIHEALSLATLAAIAVHGFALLGDGWLHPSLADTLVPFATSYRPVWTSAGIIAAYGLAILSLTYYVRARIGVARWRRLHRFIALFWLLGVVHTLGAGTDAGQAWFLVLVAVVVLPPLVLLGVRLGSRSKLGRPTPPPQPGRTQRAGPGAGAIALRVGDAARRRDPAGGPVR